MNSLLHLSKWSTWQEINSQPDIWENWGKTLDQQVSAHSKWISECEVDEIWLSGAGTSAYIGDLITAALQSVTNIPIKSVASTDLVSCPDQFIRAEKTPLVISFGRSGNSSESKGVLQVLDALCPSAPRLNITCNKDSALALDEGSSSNRRIICLPESTNDTGFAMTSSYSTMLLTCLSILDPALADTNKRMILLATAARELLTGLSKWSPSTPPTGRVVFLGSGGLRFAAREAALKVLELTCGHIPAIWDSPLGFRHGPKSFVQGDTKIVLFKSNNSHTSQYERDLIDEVKRQFNNIDVITVGTGNKCDISVDSELPDHWNAVLYLIVAQILAVKWSNNLDFNVDDPFAGESTLTRVVQGVKLYPAAGN